MSAINFKAGFGAVVAANPKVWEFDRSLTVGASEVFGCIRHNRFKKLHPELATEPEDADDPEWGHTERGNVMENEFAVPCLKGMFGEDNCFYMGDEQKTFVDGRLSATPDGIVTDQSRDALSEYGVEDIGESGQFATEIKSFGNEYAAPKRVRIPDPNDPAVLHVRYEAKPRHVGQAIVQMGLFRRKTNYSPDFAAVIYLSPTNLKDIRPAIVKYDDSVYLRAKARADEVFDPTKKLEDFAAEGRLINECQYCDFQDACNKLDLDRFTPTARPMNKVSDEEKVRLEELTKKVFSLRAQAKTLEGEKKTYEADLKEMLLELGTNRVSGADWSASMTKNNGRKSLDKDKLISDFDIDLDDYMTEGMGYFTLRVKADA